MVSGSFSKISCTTPEEERQLFLTSTSPYYPLATDYNGLGIGAMNALYYEWASFVEFLIGTYGRAQFDQVYSSGGSAVGAANYQGVYGKPLAELEREWLAWIDAA